MRWAIYRIHYGLDFLSQSINSILDSVDKVFVVYSLNPWVRKPTVNYLGKDIPMPNLHEDVRTFMYDHFNEEPKVSLIQREFTTPLNQFPLIYEMCASLSKSPMPKFLLFMEPDMVFFKPDVEVLFTELSNSDNLPCIGTHQIELWKSIAYRIPQRDRIGPMLWNLGRVSKLSTHFGTWHPDYQITTKKVKNYNFGFCLNPKTMLYKHLSALNFSNAIGDSIPSQTWYEEKWLNWHPNTTNLEISAAHTHFIPKAQPYKMNKDIKKQIGAT